MRTTALIFILAIGLPACAHAQDGSVGSECVPEIKQFCLDLQPGRPRINCLIRNKDKASPACKKFIEELSR
jgi:hypothetical protein